jgi:hypothetical protein
MDANGFATWWLHAMDGYLLHACPTFESQIEYRPECSVFSFIV